VGGLAGWRVGGNRTTLSPLESEQSRTVLKNAHRWTALSEEARGRLPLQRPNEPAPTGVSKRIRINGSITQHDARLLRKGLGDFGQFVDPAMTGDRSFRHARR